jgi:hypothetical protein
MIIKYVKCDLCEEEQNIPAEIVTLLTAEQTGERVSLPGWSVLDIEVSGTGPNWVRRYDLCPRCGKQAEADAVEAGWVEADG